MNTNIIINSFSMLLNNNRSSLFVIAAAAAGPPTNHISASMPKYSSLQRSQSTQTTTITKTIKTTLQQHRDHSRSSARRNTSAAATTTPITNNNEGDKRATTSKEPFSLFLASSLQKQQQQQQHPHDHDNSNSQKMAMVSMPLPAPPPPTPPPAATHESTRKKNTTTRVPPGFWHNKQNHRGFFDWAATQLNVRNACLDDWYAVTCQDVRKIGGSGLLRNYYNNSLQQALASVYPEHEWLPWKFKSAAQGYWRDTQNHRKFFDWAATQLNVRKACLDDWYQITGEDVCKIGGRGLLFYYNGSLQQALTSVYPEHDWLPWKFYQVPSSFWHNKQNHRRFFDWAATQLNISNARLDDWYAVTCEDVYKLGGRGLLESQYNCSLQQALASVYPEHEWLPWKFKHAAQGFWRDKQNHRRFFDWAEKQLGKATTTTTAARTADDDDDNNISGGGGGGGGNEAKQSTWTSWYTVSAEQVHALGGGALLNDCYGGSLIRALAAVYPEREWDPWRFQWCALPKDELVDEPTLRRYIERTLAVALRVETLDDWHRVSLKRARQCDGYATMVQRHGGLLPVLKWLYPDHEWDAERMRGRDKRSSQRMLRLATQKLFPGEGKLQYSK